MSDLTQQLIIAAAVLVLIVGTVASCARQGISERHAVEMQKVECTSELEKK